MKMSDIAKIAGVSKATVSRVINNPAQVTPKLRERVEKVLSDTGYTPNLLAQELVTKKTKLVGIMVPNIGINVFSKIIEGITTVLSENEYTILLANTNGNLDEELKYFELFEKKHVDGIIFFKYGITQEHIKLLNNIQVPCVLMGKQNNEINVPQVVYDDYNAAKDIVSYLVREGHKKIAYIGLLKENNDISQLRKQGYLDSMRDHNLEIKEEYIGYGNFEISSGYKAMKSILDSADEKPTAVFAITDRLAFGAIHCLKENLYNVPQDVSVVGIDNMDISVVFDPPLTTMNYDYYGSGIYAAKLVLNIINNIEVENKNIVMEYQLEVRNSISNLQL